MTSRRALRKLSPATNTTSSFNTAPFKKVIRSLLPEKVLKPRFECQYCFEHKHFEDFIKRGAVPYNCSFHLATTKNLVCKACIEGSLSAQLDSKPLIEVGCPQCGVAWEPGEVKMLIGGKNEKRFKALDRLAKEQVLTPSDLPDGATIDVLLAKGARFW